MKSVYFFCFYRLIFVKALQIILEIFRRGVDKVSQNINKIKMLLKMVMEVLSNLCTSTTLETQILWPLLTSGRCLEVVDNSDLTVLSCV
jgi:hypothetical protein